MSSYETSPDTLIQVICSRALPFLYFKNFLENYDVYSGLRAILRGHFRLSLWKILSPLVSFCAIPEYHRLHNL